MPLYLIRHGESEGNAQRIFQGQLDPPLTPLGRRQAQRLGRWLRQHGVRAARIEASPLQRAMQTAQLIAEQLAIGAAGPVPLHPAPGLREYAGGLLEGLTEEEQEARFPGYLARPLEERGDFAAYGGEGYAEMQERLTHWLESLDPAQLAEQDVLAIAHGGSLYQLLKLCCGWPVPRHFQAHISNCCCIKLRPRHFGQQLLMMLEWMVPLELLGSGLLAAPQTADDPGLE